MDSDSADFGSDLIGLTDLLDVIDFGTSGVPVRLIARVVQAALTDLPTNSASNQVALAAPNIDYSKLPPAFQNYGRF